MSGKRLSVVIITWNEKDRLEACLRSLVSVMDLRKDEIVVVDNGSTDGTDALVKEQFPKINYTLLEENIGVGPARNRGMVASNGNYIMNLDNDTIIPNSDEKLGDKVEKIFTDNPDIGLFSFALHNADGTPQHNIRRFPNIIEPFVARLGILRILPIFKHQLDHHLYNDINFDELPEILDVDYVLGANQVFTRDIATKVGGYDEAIFFGPEDAEFCLRIKRAGLRVCRINTFSIQHEYQRRTRIINIMVLRHIKGFYYLFWKEKSFWSIKP